MAKFEFEFGEPSGDVNECWIAVYLLVAPGILVQIGWLHKEKGKAIEVIDAAIFEPDWGTHEAVAVASGRDELFDAALEDFNRTWRARDAKRKAEYEQLIKELVVR